MKQSVVPGEQWGGEGGSGKVGRRDSQGAQKSF